jgi:alpha-tubulin suppressor-like RCC1 family protein
MNLTKSFSGLSDFSLFMDTDGKLYTSGSSNLPESTYGSTDLQLVQLPPHPQGGAFQVVSVGCGLSHTIALTLDSRLIGWGNNSHGELGLGREALEGSNPPSILPFSPESEITQVTCGSYFSAAVTADGSLFTWGENNNGELGLGHYDRMISPTRVSGLPPVISVGCGYGHAAALTRDGHVWVWGRNANGELGLGQSEPGRFTPTLHPTLQDISILSVAYGNLAVTKSGEVWAWGWNGTGGLGNGTKTSLYLPAHLYTRTDIIGIASGGGHAAALLLDGTFLVWGANGHGQLGKGQMGHLDDNLSPNKNIFDKPDVVAVGCLNDHSFVVTSEGEIHAFGCGIHGRLGDRGEKASEFPVLVEGLKAKLPNIRWRDWVSVGQWLFLGRQSKDSSLYLLPIEVIFNLVKLFC